MQKQFRLVVNLPLALALFSTACGSSVSAPDSGVPDTMADAGPTSDAGDAATGGTNPLGAVCGSGSECASGFCVDHLCCDSACSDQCYTCEQPGSPGTCAPISQGEDLVASAPCSGASRCVLDATGIPACRLNDKQPCSRNDECASGFCPTFFADGDGDGYGVASSSSSVCDVMTARPPAGYAALAGDCCDSDDLANPGVAFTTYSVTPHACGSFDWNCDGAVQRQTTMLCPATMATVACGASCYIIALGTSTKLFTQACR